MKALRAAIRLLRVTGYALRGWLIITFAFPQLTQVERETHVQRWARGMLAMLGIELRVRGTPPERGPLLLVSNHISWLDILVIHAARHCRFVSKSDVKRWPVIGTLATGAGTLYIERESRRDAMRVVHRMAESLRSGDILAVFPEGTTSDGSVLLPFHANLIQAAISADAPVLPLAMNFIDAASGRISMAARYIDDDTLARSVWRLVTSAPLVAMVTFGEPQRAQGRDRRAWARALRDAVADLRNS